MKLFIGSLVVLLFVGGLLMFIKSSDVTSDPVGPKTGTLYDTMAKCIKDSGAIFYGARWCPHCQEQKREFGDSAQYLPYVECATADNKGQTKICADNGIKSYPTWKFKDGTELNGTISLEDLAQKTSCPIPKQANKINSVSSTTQTTATQQ